MKAFFKKMEAQGLMVTYDDVRLRTHHSNILPVEAELRTRFSKRITLNVPLVSSPMDTVTTADMAIAMAEAGGLGIIHRGLSPEAQAKEVGRVKNRLNGRIATPITVRDSATVAEVLEMIEERKFLFHTFPVVDEKGHMVGLITGNDLDFCVEPSHSVQTIMTPFGELAKALPGLDRKEAYELMLKRKKKVLPLVDENHKLAGMYVFSDLRRIFSALHQSGNTVDQNGQLMVGAAVGVGEGALKRAELLARKKCDVFHIDTAHGDSQNVMSTIIELKKRYPHIDTVAGNVSGGESAKRLAGAGADGVLVGQGPGSICTTRVIAGVGVPQVSAVFECSRALEGTEVPLCADGGINNSGDMVIALAVGASTVMVGRLLAGTDEAPGETRFFNGMQVKDYRGMGSLGAMRDNASSRERYGQAGSAPSKVVPEGIEGIVPYKGSVKTVLDQYVGGIRSGMGYHGARTLSELAETAVLFRISGAGLAESHPHDITITADAPNYRRAQ
jgi:IMP dehydrogenase